MAVSKNRKSNTGVKMRNSRLKWSFLTLALMMFPPHLKSEENLEKATFAGGCFWCMEHPFETLDGVKEVVSGYIGGELENPTYEDVSRGDSGHLEAIQIVFDSNRVSYEDLLEVFWRQVNPTDPGGQFVDRGTQYTSAVFLSYGRAETESRTFKTTAG
jgi:peptide methionine sulfoxide reductase msrA/msrB